MQSRRQTMLIALVATGAMLVGCGGSSSGPAELEANRGLPMWAGEMQQLYDDQIDPAALGLSMSGVSPAEDPLLPLRAQSSDITARVRVQTLRVQSITGDSGTRSSYMMAVQVGEPTLTAPRVEDRTFELEVGPQSLSFGIVQSMESSIRGSIFVGFIKRFAGADGPEVHYHLTSDNADVHKAIRQVALLEELAKE